MKGKSKRRKEKRTKMKTKKSLRKCREILPHLQVRGKEELGRRRRVSDKRGKSRSKRIR